MLARLGEEHALARCLIVNYIPIRPHLCGYLGTRFCSVEALRCLFEIQLTAVAHVAECVAWR